MKTPRTLVAFVFLDSAAAVDNRANRLFHHARSNADTARGLHATTNARRRPEQR